MSKAYKASKSPWILFLLLLAGSLAGSSLSGTLAKSLPFLAATSNIGLKPTTLDLHFLSITFGFNVALGPVTALGLLLGYLIYRKV